MELATFCSTGIADEEATGKNVPCLPTSQMRRCDRLWEKRMETLVFRTQSATTSFSHLGMLLARTDVTQPSPPFPEFLTPQT